MFDELYLKEQSSKDHSLTRESDNKSGVGRGNRQSYISVQLFTMKTISPCLSCFSGKKQPIMKRHELSVFWIPLQLVASQLDNSCNFQVSEVPRTG